MSNAADRRTRRFPRYEVNALVDVTGTEVLLFHKIQNISLGGISIQSPTIEEIGTIVDLVINFPGPSADSISIKGEVVWVNREPPMDMGIRYVDLDEGSKEKLKKLLALVK
jgi:hypothetical protein